MIIYFIAIVLIITTIIVLYNFITAPVLKVSSGAKDDNFLVSVLIPARNEEENIKICLAGIINQTYKNIEVIVLDDESEDKTYSYASEAAARDKRIRVVKGNPLPDNFTGKNWACHQLSLLAAGSYLLFIDADVKLKPDSIRSAINETELSKLELLSVFPSQIIHSVGEWLLVPLMNWLLLTFLPLKLIHSSRSSSFAAANGQFMLFNRKTYQKAGGHKILSNTITEDIEFVRLFKMKGYSVKTYLGGDLVYCRMYKNFGDSLRGFSKNFYPGLKLNPLYFISLNIFIVIFFNVSLVLIFINDVFILLAILILLQRMLISIKSRQNPIINVLLHPLQMTMLLIVGLISLRLSKKRKRIWKGRTF
jgi:glycosyltransferase involved in cell wall biosynthesis